MLGGADVIDLRDFPEAKDKSMVDDAFLEAYYQNPLILGVTAMIVLLSDHDKREITK